MVLDFAQYEALFPKIMNTGPPLFRKSLVESGLTFLNTLMKLKLINNIYVFQSSYQLRKIGKNNTSINLIKKLKLSDKINVNLNGDKLYKIKFKNV